ncbi:putative conserved secreted protein [Operophtera brumata]|uniref:Putative conserved secreted protein n=1 Tax=Operophtera brumata TaxID=104452 RepID=A0A0L7LPG1_OPEBR|nr:putative conserved secreted protein [Operophtera brumata]
MIEMKMTVQLLVLVIALVTAEAHDPTQIEKYDEKIKTYKLDVPGKAPITIIENEEDNRWKDISINPKDNQAEIKNLMTHIIHDLDGDKPRCYGPSCQEGYSDEGFRESSEGIQEDFEDYMLAAEKLKDYNDYSKDRLQAITALAAKLKKEKLKLNRFPQMQNEDEDDNNDNVMTSWNRLKVKQHKHPYDDKDGWVSLEPVAWSTSKISKWKPNVKKQKPNHWHEDEDGFPNDDNDRFTSNQGNGNRFSYPQKKPIVTRPTFINNKLHLPQDFESELPSRPSWTKPQQMNPLSWSPDEGRRPHKPNCDQDDHYSDDDSVYYGISDSVVTDPRPANFPYEYEALHQASGSKRPFKRPTQVVYAGSEYEDDRSSRPPYGDGQWVLLSTTKGYRNKKRQRSLNPVSDDRSDVSTMTSHQAVALTVLPVDSAHTNMTTSHGGMLEVEKSFKTVEESKRDMDKKNDLDVSATHIRPTRNRIVRRKLVSNASPDSTSLLAAVGAGMVPATMAMVVPMMLGRRRRRRDLQDTELHLDNVFRY